MLMRFIDNLLKMDERDAAIAGQNALIDKLGADLDASRRVNARLTTEARDAADEIARLKGRDRSLNEGLAAAVKQAADLRVELDHARHCYEQCEVYRQALADERNAAYAKVRDARKALQD